LGRRAAALLALLRDRRPVEHVRDLLLPAPAAAAAAAAVPAAALFSGLSPEAAAELLTQAVLDISAASPSQLLAVTERSGAPCSGRQHGS
jgi:hypothetical protein